MRANAPNSITTVRFGSFRLISVMSPLIVPRPMETSCFRPLKSIFASSSSLDELDSFFVARTMAAARARLDAAKVTRVTIFAGYARAASISTASQSVVSGAGRYSADVDIKRGALQLRSPNPRER